MIAILDTMLALLLLLSPLFAVGMLVWLLPAWLVLLAVAVVLIPIGFREEQRQLTAARAASRAARPAPPAAAPAAE
jgi:uncharacterized membrane protein